MECAIKFYLNMQCPTKMGDSTGLAWVKDRPALFKTFQISMLRWTSFFLANIHKYIFPYKKAS